MLNFIKDVFLSLLSDKVKLWIIKFFVVAEPLATYFMDNLPKHYIYITVVETLVLLVLIYLIEKKLKKLEDHIDKIKSFETYISKINELEDKLLKSKEVFFEKQNLSIEKSSNTKESAQATIKFSVNLVNSSNSNISCYLLYEFDINKKYQKTKSNIINLIHGKSEEITTAVDFPLSPTAVGPGALITTGGLEEVKNEVIVNISLYYGPLQLSMESLAMKKSFKYQLSYIFNGEEKTYEENTVNILELRYD